MTRIRVEPDRGCGVDVFRWRRGGVDHLTVLAHRRFEFVQGEPARASEWRPLATHLPRLFAPHAEVAVSLVGSAHASSPTGVTSMTVRLGLYSNDAAVFDKTIFVFGDRSPASPEISRPFREMPLTWSRAQRTQLNPKGSLLPNLVDTRDPHEAVSFDLLPLDTHGALLGVDPRVLVGDVLTLPDEVPLSDLVPAPKDQRVVGLGGDEWLLLDGMTNGQARLMTRLSSEAWLAKGTAVDSNIDFFLPLSLAAIRIDAEDGSFVCSYVGERELASSVEVSLTVTPFNFESDAAAREVPNDGRATSARGGESDLSTPLDEETETGVMFSAPAAAAASASVSVSVGTTVDLTQIASAIPKLGATPWDKSSSGPIASAPHSANLARPMFEADDTADLPGRLPKRDTEFAETFLGGTADGDALPFSESPMTAAPKRSSAHATPWDHHPRPDVPAWRPRDLTSETTLVVETPTLLRELANRAALERADPERSVPSGSSKPVAAVSSLPIAEAGVAALARLRAGERVATLAGLRLAKLDFSGLDLDGIDFTGSDLTGVRLTGATLRRAVLNGACLEGANLEGAVLDGALLVGARLSSADFTSARFVGVDCSKTSGEGVRFSRIGARGATFESAVLTFAIFDGADLEGSRFDDATLTSSSWRDARCRKASFLRARLSSCDFGKADLTLAVLRRADLGGATLDNVQAKGGDLSGVSLRGASLREACLRETNLSQASLVGATVEFADLRDATLHEADLTGVDTRTVQVSRAGLNDAKSVDTH